MQFGMEQRVLALIGLAAVNHKLQSMNIVCKKIKEAGFTLIELLVVIGIISVITFLLLVQQSKFDSSTVLRSLVYNMALSVRQTQVYGVSVSESALGTAAFAHAFGLYFNPAASSNNYILFADSAVGATPNDSRYEAGEETSTFKISPNYMLSEVCAIKNDGTKRCSGSDDSSGAGTISTLTILFKRPNPDAVIIGLNSAGSLVGGDMVSQYTSAYVQVRATDGTKRGLHVYITGQVSVDSIGQTI